MWAHADNVSIIESDILEFEVVGIALREYETGANIDQTESEANIDQTKSEDCMALDEGPVKLFAV